MLELNKMNDEMLKMVCGGDYGDENHDNNPNQSWYQVGEFKEVYFVPLHVFTKRSKIEEKKFEDGHWVYKFIVETTEYDSECTNPTTVKWVSANHIEK